MQWSSDVNGGFTAGKPWLPLADDYQALNVETERKQSTSLLNLYHRLIELRRAEAALSVGEIAPLPADSDLMAYVRKCAEHRLAIVLNLSPNPRTFNMADLKSGGRLLISTHLDRDQEELSNEVALRADEGVVVELL
jgi:alpha-glucosidase